MENINAAHYESFIRKAHQVGRNGIIGANEDTFRNFETAYGLYISEKQLADKGLPRKWDKSVDELAFEYAISAGKISVYIEMAIDAILKKHDDKFSDEQYTQLEHCLVRLENPTIENILDIIKIADEIVMEIDFTAK